MRDQSKSIKWFSTAVIILGMMQISACGEFSYKRGATPADLENSKLQCSSQYQTKAEINQCLKQQGWIVVDMDAEAEPEAVAATTLEESAIITSYSKSSSDPFSADKETTVIKPQPLPTDPYEKIKVNSWWKIGGSMDSLKADGKLCQQSLGNDYYANNNFSEVSLGIANCMKKKGWRMIMSN